MGLQDNDFVTMIIEKVALPGEKLEGFDDRMTYEEALELAKTLEDDSQRLFAALEKMKEEEREE